MCYYVESKLTAKEIYSLENEYVVKWEEEESNDFFVANGYDHPKLPVITSEGRFKLYRWGLVPHWIKEASAAKVSMDRCLNAISEEATEKSSYRDVIVAKQFCIIPVNGFFEWHTLNKTKYPHFIYPKNGGYFLFAGLYNRWVNKSGGEIYDTFTILTTVANERLAWIHNTKKRMPVILTNEESKLWLDKTVPYEEKFQLMKPCDVNLHDDHPISKLITSKTENRNTEEVIKPVEYPELALS